MCFVAVAVGLISIGDSCGRVVTVADIAVLVGCLLLSCAVWF